jgi:16S rRNA (adenine1518-N6/adenine1519-N6)-dimethyltransferase
MLAYADLRKNDILLEIGPGIGTLTFSLAKRVKQVIAVEIDRGFSLWLTEKIDDLGKKNIKIISGDFLKLSPERITAHGTPEKLVSNFPYSVCLKAIARCLEEYPFIGEIIGTVQREIAQRAGALPGDKNYSAVSVLIQSLADVRVMEKDISPQNFFPAPEVTSVILRLTRSGGTLPFPRELFRRMVKASFSNRRKSLANNLCTMKGLSDKEAVREVVSAYFHDVNIRAEHLSVGEFTRLARAIEKLVAG